jgi:organic hydroperoxide reductase OsmC/OhrA
MSTQVRHKEFHFPVRVGWDGGRRTRAEVDGKPPLQIAPPPVFRGTDPDLWSPEDVLVSAAASCLAVTITGLVEREGVPIHALSVHSDGCCGRREDGRFGFTRIDQTVELVTDPEHAAAARALAEQAERTCLVTASLSLPVHTTIEIQTSSTGAAA